jgi:exosome complex component RRP40
MQSVRLTLSPMFLQSDFEFVSLLSPSHPLLPSIGAKFPFELAIGVNGRIWVKAADIEKTIKLMKAIQEA